MRNFATPTLSYVGAVLGVIAVATFAVFNLRGMAATGYRHWDADINRIIARQQEKKYRLDGTALADVEMPGVASDVGPPIAVLGRGMIDDENAANSRGEEAAAQKSRVEGAKKNNRRAERKRQQYIPAAFAAVPKIAGSTTTLFGLR